MADWSSFLERKLSEPTSDMNVVSSHPRPPPPAPPRKASTAELRKWLPESSSCLVSEPRTSSFLNRAWFPEPRTSERFLNRPESCETSFRNRNRPSFLSCEFLKRGIRLPTLSVTSHVARGTRGLQSALSRPLQESRRQCGEEHKNATSPGISHNLQLASVQRLW